MFSAKAKRRFYIDQPLKSHSQNQVKEAEIQPGLKGELKTMKIS